MQYRNIIRRCSCTGIFVLIIVDLIRGIILVTVTVVIASAGIISTMPTEYCDQHFYDSDDYDYNYDTDSSDQTDNTTDTGHSIQ